MRFSADIKPIEERQAAVDALIRAKLDPAAYAAFRDSVKMDRVRYAVMAAMLGRELWDRYWAVFRDGIEVEAEKLFTEMEKQRSRDRGIFG